MLQKEGNPKTPAIHRSFFKAVSPTRWLGNSMCWSLLLTSCILIGRIYSATTGCDRPKVLHKTVYLTISRDSHLLPSPPSRPLGLSGMEEPHVSPQKLGQDSGGRSGCCDFGSSCMGRKYGALQLRLRWLGV